MEDDGKSLILNEKPADYDEMNKIKISLYFQRVRFLVFDNVCHRGDVPRETTELGYHGLGDQRLGAQRLGEKRERISCKFKDKICIKITTL